MFGFVHPLLDEEEDKAGRDEGHGKDNADGHHYISGGRGPVIEWRKANREVEWKATIVHQSRTLTMTPTPK